VRLCCRFLGGVILIVMAQPVSAQLAANLGRFGSIPTVPGYEGALAKVIQTELSDLSPRIDNAGNVVITVGTGAPHRLVATAIDSPGYVVSGITTDGFLRVQRVPQSPPNNVFDTLHFAQPVFVSTLGNRWINGVFAGLSVHLQPGRQEMPKMNRLDEMYVDIGAATAEEVHAAGVNVLDAVVLNEPPRSLGEQMTGPTVGDLFGAAALRELAWKLRGRKLAGTTTIAFVTEAWAGGRGLNRLLEEVHADEMIYIGRPFGRAATPQMEKESPHPNSGVLLMTKDPTQPLNQFETEIQAMAAKRGIPLRTWSAGPPQITGYAKPSEFPARFAQLGVATLWPVTPTETLSLKDLGSLEQLLEAYLKFSEQLLPVLSGGVAGCEKSEQPLPILIEEYGASGHESAVREEVKKLLRQPAGQLAVTDSAGNLILHFGDAKHDAKPPKILFVAHMDEIGYEVKSIEPDGRLLVGVLGGGYTEYFLGHVVLVHKSDGTTSGGVLELPGGWDRPDFEWPHGPRTLDEPAHVYVGTRSSEETQKLGIKAGDWVTIPKEYRPLLGTRANARSFDDRVGCAALIEAVRALGLELPGRDVTFVWSTEEEVGLKGAAAVAERMAKEGKTLDFVFAIDTFVSSDSPLESKRFADAEIGKGFVIRAVDNSNITPREYVDRVVKLARENNISVQYGVTGGGNDGAVFQRYGSVDIPLGWPLRYSHSPGEVIDTRDVDALAKIIAVLARSW
jgi:putative aminopeptidase FrvX